MSKAGVGGFDDDFGARAVLLYCCFTAALLLLYCCFTAALLLLYCCFYLRPWRGLVDLTIMLARRVFFSISSFFIFYFRFRPGRGLVDLTITLARVYGNTQIVATPSKAAVKQHTDQ